ETNALDGLHKMKSFGFQVYIISPHDPYIKAETKLSWINQKIGSSWAKNLIISNSKSILKADFIIDSNPATKREEQFSTFTHILYDQPYNQLDSHPKRLTDWRNWKVILGCNETQE